jgi:hypothetical protein
MGHTNQCVFIPFFPPKNDVQALKAGLLARDPFTFVPFPVSYQWLMDNFITLTVAGAASDFHRFPYYPGLNSGHS